MRFANETLQIHEFFNSSTYARLVRQAEQSEVSWGDWHLRRREGDDSVSVEHEIGDSLKLRYEEKERNEIELGLDEEDEEYGLEYYLSDEESITMGVRDDEKFFGLQSKRSF